MPLGLKNTGAIYQWLVSKVFGHLIRKSIEVYVDGVIVKIKEDVRHATNLCEMFIFLFSYGMKLHHKKYVFCVRSRKFLEFMISNYGIDVNTDKV